MGMMLSPRSDGDDDDDDDDDDESPAAITASSWSGCSRSVDCAARASGDKGRGAASRE
jgi:hypothetical protein